MKNTYIRLLGILCMCETLACATIVNGQRQKLAICSVPQGAEVVIDGIKAGATPLETKVTRKDRHEIQVIKEGYLTETVATARSISGWYYGNAFLGGMIGMLVDMSSGGAYNIEPNPISITLMEDATQSTRELSAGTPLQ